MKVAYFFRAGRKERLKSASEYPKDHFYGYHELDGLDVQIIEESDLVPDRVTKIARLTFRFLNFVFGSRQNHLYWFRKSENLNLLNKFDAIIVCTVSHGIALSELKSKGLFRGRVYFIATGITHEFTSFIRLFFYRHTLKNSCLSSLSRGEIKCITEKLKPQNRLWYIPFGVDEKFWKPADKIVSENYVLSVGNDTQRDYETLINSWKPHYPELRILTRLSLPKLLPKNVRLLKGDFFKSELSDEDLRVLYQEASFIVIPLFNTAQPSGQSVALQAMACRKAVIFSKTKGLWDENVMQDRQNILLYNPIDANDLSSKIEVLLADNSLRDRIAENGYQTVLNYYTCQKMGQAIKKMIISNEESCESKVSS